jgi:hypothetical protein
MGSCDFTQTAKGKTAHEAFTNAVSQAQYDYGHAGYTGTIAEKNDFIEIPVPSDFMPHEKDPKIRVTSYADKLMDDNDKRIDDKWGPAGCTAIKDGLYYFYGWASS